MHGVFQVCRRKEAELFSRPEIAIASAVFVVVVVILALAYRWSERKRRESQDKLAEEIRAEMAGGEFIDAEEFLASWIMFGGSRSNGYVGFKYLDGPGCYVILVFDHEVEDGNWDDYEEVYVGQSVNMCQRVHNHLTGHGNGDIYADVRAGRNIYIQFNPCEEEEMNELEKSLIVAYNATASYNKTSGGGINR